MWPRRARPCLPLGDGLRDADWLVVLVLPGLTYIRTFEALLKPISENFLSNLDSQVKYFENISGNMEPKGKLFGS